MKTQILGLLLLLPFLALTQKHPKYKHPGYVVTLQGDTLVGKFKVDFWIKKAELAWTQEEFKFRPDEGDRSVRFYGVSDVKHVEFSLLEKGDTTYVFQRKQVMGADNYRLWRFLPLPRMEGTLSLYVSQELVQGMHANGLPSSDIVDTQYLAKGGVIYMVNKRFLRKELYPILGDCPEVVEKLMNKKYKVKTKDMKRLVQEYNACVTPSGS